MRAVVAAVAVAVWWLQAVKGAVSVLVWRAVIGIV